MRKPKLLCLLRRKLLYKRRKAEQKISEKHLQDSEYKRSIQSIRKRVTQSTDIIDLSELDVVDGEKSLHSSENSSMFSSANMEMRNARKVRENYASFTPEVADILGCQDDDLDDIGDALSDMHALAEAMNQELNYQAKLIDRVQDFTAETSQRTKEHRRRIDDMQK